MSWPDVWTLYVPGFVIVLAALVIFRWLAALQKRVNDHAERIAYVEAKANGKPKAGA